MVVLNRKRGSAPERMTNERPPLRHILKDHSGVQERGLSSRFRRSSFQPVTAPQPVHGRLWLMMSITAVTLTKVSGKILFRLNQHHNLL